MNTHTPEDVARTCLHCNSHVSDEFVRVCGDEQRRVHRCPNCWPNALGAVPAGINDSVHVTHSERDSDADLGFDLTVDTEITLEWADYHDRSQSYDGEIDVPNDLNPCPRPDSDDEPEGIVEVDVDPDLAPDEQLDQVLDAVLGPAE